MTHRLTALLLVLLCSTAGTIGTVAAAEHPDEAVAQFVAAELPSASYIGTCETGIPGVDAGKLCSRFVAERDGVHAYLLAIYQTGVAIWVFVGWTDDGWQVFATADAPLDSNWSDPPWP